MNKPKCKPDNGGGFKKCVYDMYRTPPKNYLSEHFCSVAARGIKQKDCEYYKEVTYEHH